MDSAISKKRVYKYLSADLALDDLGEHHIKISTFPDMNDPFELTGGIDCEPKLCEPLAALLSHLKEWCGVLCFSQDWHNAMLWSHYAAKHSGICLGFDVSGPVEMRDPHYVTTRQEIAPGLRILLDAATHFDEPSPSKLEECKKVAEKMLLTKYDAWRYENEVRMFVELKQEQKRDGRYFAELDDYIRPSAVILGPRCTTTEDEIKAAIEKGGYQLPITVVSTMLSPSSFEVIAKTMASSLG